MRWLPGATRRAVSDTPRTALERPCRVAREPNGPVDFVRSGTPTHRAQDLPLAQPTTAIMQLCPSGNAGRPHAERPTWHVATALTSAVSRRTPHGALLRQTGLLSTRQRAASPRGAVARRLITRAKEAVPQANRLRDADIASSSVAGLRGCVGVPNGRPPLLRPAVAPAPVGASGANACCTTGGGGNDRNGSTGAVDALEAASGVDIIP